MSDVTTAAVEIKNCYILGYCAMLVEVFRKVTSAVASGTSPIVSEFLYYCNVYG